MPLIKGRKNRKRNFHELRHGKTFAKTARKFGKQRAQRQMVAIELSNERKTGSRKRRAKR